MSGTRRIDIRIDKLVLEGISPLHRSRVVEAIERELRRLASEERLPVGPTGSFTLDRGPGDTVAEISGTRPETIGAQVARSIWAGGRRAVTAGSRHEPVGLPPGHRVEGGKP